MEGFFGFIFGICILIIRGFIQIDKQTKNINKFNAEIIMNDIKQRKRISKYLSNNNQMVYYDNINKHQVYKTKDANGIVRWKYTKKNQWVSNNNNNNNFKKMINAINVIKQNKIKQKWVIIENFWEDSIIRDENNCDSKSTYLDDFRVAPDVTREEEWKKIQKENKSKNNFYLDSFKKNSLLYASMNSEDKKIIKKYFYDNNPLNQKIYIKNLRPYQLAGIYKEYNNKHYTIVYLIRFGKESLTLKETHNILDKQNSILWTKWYAITKEEFESLTNLNKGKLWCPSNLIYKDKKEITMLKYYMKQVDLSEVAFNENINEYNWYLNSNINFYGIKKAFNNKDIFVEDEL